VIGSAQLTDVLRWNGVANAGAIFHRWSARGAFYTNLVRTTTTRHRMADRLWPVSESANVSFGGARWPD